MSEKKYREFWYNRYTCEVHLGQLSEDDKHVIEYQAYADLKAENERLRELLKNLSDRHNWQPSLGECICEAHIAARQALGINAKE